ncbi:unnamed protein product [Phytophthora fragariaefolia]|uniref:Unnamed protein product n=1 Tax=Phytophthora fragariaefolia TaxID=1490495 RepID=A0A9W6YC24_9STRA|nr:unnamed protein product [Phytophthora fragariaefolia]
MDCVLRGLTWICRLVYLDDVIIFTRGSVSRHVVELAVVLKRLAEAGLSLKATKCSFATTKIEYLGHELTPEGIQPTPWLVKAIVEFPTSTDEAQVRRFVALVGFYKRLWCSATPILWSLCIRVPITGDPSQMHPRVVPVSISERSPGSICERSRY